MTLFLFVLILLHKIMFIALYRIFTPAKPLQPHLVSKLYNYCTFYGSQKTVGPDILFSLVSLAQLKLERPTRIFSCPTLSNIELDYFSKFQSVVLIAFLLSFNNVGSEIKDSQK